MGLHKDVTGHGLGGGRARAAGGRVRRAGACMLSTYNHHIHMRRLDKGSAGGATGRTLPGVARVIKRYSAYSAERELVAKRRRACRYERESESVRL